MTAHTTTLIRSLFESPLPVAVLAAGGGVMTEERTGIAVLVVLAGGSFLLNVWLSIKKAGAYSRSERQTEVKAEKADMVSRHELDRVKADLHTAMKDFRGELVHALTLLTEDFHSTTRDMTSAIGRLQGAQEAAKRRVPS